MRSSNRSPRKVLYRLKFVDAAINYAAGEIMNVYDQNITIGRSSGNTIEYDAHWISISRNHAFIQVKNGQCKILQPPQSRNPILINDKVVNSKQKKLNNNDIIQFSYQGPKIVFLKGKSNDNSNSSSPLLIISYVILFISILSFAYTLYKCLS